MKKLFLLSVAATLISSLSFATIRRVGYPGIAVAGVDFPSVTEANNDVDGTDNVSDTIQIYGTVTGGIITKKLVIIGFGYNLDANIGLQAQSSESPSVCDISFSSGSDGSFITGCKGSFLIYDATETHVAITNITFFRCYINSLTLYNRAAYDGPISNVNVFSCVVINGGMADGAGDAYDVTNVSFFNCIMQGQFTMYKSGSSLFASNCVSMAGSVSGTGYFYLNDAGGLIKNCILYYSFATTNVNTIYENNFFEEGAPSTTIPGSNNRWSQDFAAIFTRNGRGDDRASSYGAEEFDEDYWTLTANSPAINGGFNVANQPTNCGIYGGELAYRYKLSGVPAIPAIYQLTAPTLNASTNPYNVTISVRSNN